MTETLILLSVAVLLVTGVLGWFHFRFNGIERALGLTTAAPAKPAQAGLQTASR